MSWQVYMVRCADQSLYTGITKDVDRRIHEHNHEDAKASKYTRARRPVQLVFQESHENQSMALKRELQLKSLTRSQKLALIEQQME